MCSCLLSWVTTMGSSVDIEDDFLFDEQLLKTFVRRLDHNNLLVRPLKSGDFDRGFIKLLNELTQVGNVSKQQFRERFNQMKAGKSYYVLVIEDCSTEQVIGAATLFVELKFIHGCAQKGYLEDVVVAQSYRGKQLGKILIESVTQLGQQLGAYKVILNCKDNLIKFYEQLGFIREEGNANMLQIRFQSKH